MADIPETSTTLLKDLASSAQHVRWGEFFARYEALMRAYLTSHFPGVEADDVIQETMKALVGVLPNYRYDPAHFGFFHDYLIGILRNKALDELRRRERMRKGDSIAGERQESLTRSENERQHLAWMKSVFAVALQEFLADGAITERRKQAFVRVRVKGEDRQKVADELGVSLNVVNLSVSRSMGYIQEKVEQLKRL